MAEIVNLNRFRKSKKKAERELQAAENRVNYGRTKAEKNSTRANQELLASKLDGHKRDDE